MMIWRNVTGKKSVGRAHIFTLDCGHAVRRQYSYGCPKISRCKACESLRDGTSNDVSVNAAVSRIQIYGE